MTNQPVLHNIRILDFTRVLADSAVGTWGRSGWPIVDDHHW